MHAFYMRNQHIPQVVRLDEDENQWDAYPPETIIQRCNTGFWVGIVASNDQKTLLEAFAFYMFTKKLTKIIRISGSEVGKRFLIERMQTKLLTSKIEVFVPESNLLWCKQLASLNFSTTLVPNLYPEYGLDGVQCVWKRSIMKEKAHQKLWRN